MLPLPTNLKDAIVYFSDQDVAIEFLRDVRWPSGVACPTCGSKDVYYIKTQRRWKCKNVHPKQQFSVKVGTIFEDSAIGLDKWLPAVWLVTNCKNGISSYELSKDLESDAANGMVHVASCSSCDACPFLRKTGG